jgi:hypothetical protein
MSKVRVCSGGLLCVASEGLPYSLENTVRISGIIQDARSRPVLPRVLKIRGRIDPSCFQSAIANVILVFKIQSSPVPTLGHRMAGYVLRDSVVCPVD